MKCRTCPRETDAGHSGSAGNTTICLICWTAAVMRDYRDPITEKSRRALREKKAQGR
jgi:hypothetical protein